jgi:hypothetical protein
MIRDDECVVQHMSGGRTLMWTLKHSTLDDCLGFLIAGPRLQIIVECGGERLVSETHFDRASAEHRLSVHRGIMKGRGWKV